MPTSLGDVLEPLTPEMVDELASHLAGRGRQSLEETSHGSLIAAWEGAIAALRDPRSPERLELWPVLLRSAGLSAQGLAAGLEAVLAGLAGAGRWVLSGPSRVQPDGGLELIVLAGNLPGLAAQPLLRALASRRPALLKSATAEPFFAPALVRALAAREPALGEAYAAVTWRGGHADDAPIEAAALDRASLVVAYGEAATIAALEHRAPGRVEAHGPRASLAVVAADAELAAAADGLAHDIALFDQRGCLSVQAVYTAGDARALAVALAGALAQRALEWPAGPIGPETAAAVQQLRATAELRGLLPASLPLAAGTVILEPDAAFRPSPGLRTVRVHALSELERLPSVLAPWRGRLQGVATAGLISGSLLRGLIELGVTRIAPAGQLQRPGADWDGLAPALA